MKILPYISTTPVKTIVYESDEVKEIKKGISTSKREIRVIRENN